MKAALKSALSESDGKKVSSNRLFLGFIILFILASSTYITITTGAIPPLHDSWIYLVGIFASAAFGGKAADAVKTMKKPEAKGEEK